MKKWISNSLLLVFTTLVTLLLCEYIVRLIKPQHLVFVDNNIWGPDSVFSWNLKPNIHQKVNTGEKTVTLYTNKDGLRINYPNDSTPEHVDMSVLAIGDSFIEAIQVENDSTVNEHIGRRLQNRLGKTVNVENHGVSGYSPNQYYLRAKVALQKKKFDLGIIYLFSGNDFIEKFDTLLSARNTSTSKAFDPIKAFTSKGTVRENILYPINNILEQNSHLYILFKNSSQTLLSNAGLTASYFPETMLRRNASSEVWTNTANICDAMFSLFQSHHTPLLIVMIPANYQVNQSLLDQKIKGFKLNLDSIDIHQPSVRFSEEMAKRNLNYLDALPFFTSKNLRGIQLYGTIDAHLNETGHRYLSEFIAPAVDSLITQISSK